MSDTPNQTQFIHAGVEPDKETGATQVPIHQSAAFAYDSAKDLEDVFQGRAFGYYYSRVSNPTVLAVEKRLAALENGVGALLVSSGMAAITTAVMALARNGENIVVGQSLFGSTYYLLQGLIEDCGIEVRFVDPTNTQAFEQAIDDKTRMIYVEAMGNPKLDFPNIKALSSLAKQSSLPLVVDTTLTTACLFNAKQLGVDVVVCATTKYIAGGGTTIGGAVIDLGNMNWKDFKGKAVKAMADFGSLAFVGAIRKLRANMGNCQAPFNAYLTQLGLDTLGLRMHQHSENALKLATFFESHNAVRDVRYPGLVSHPQHELAKTQLNGIYGGLLTVRVGSKQRAFAVLDALKLVRDLVNIGDAKTLAVYPASTIYRNLIQEQREQAGVFDDMIRISVGLENSDDIIADFAQALEEIK